MDHKNVNLKLSYSEEGTFGNYGLAENLLTAQYSNDRTFKPFEKMDQHKEVHVKSKI